MLLAAGTGHPGGSLGMADVFTALYFSILNHNPKKPLWQERDRLIISNGHICPVLYAAMAEAGYFPSEELLTLRKLGSRLQGHPHRETLAGLETTSGPLGSGLSQAEGMALSLKMDKKKSRVFCVMSDGEHDEGNTWEAVLFAAKYKLNNLVCFMDRNNIQIDGHTEDIMPLNSLKKKYEAFNWNVLEINGNEISEILVAFKAVPKLNDAPTMIICNVIPGKGVSFMENDSEWHGKAPNKEQAAQALAELEQQKEYLLKSFMLKSFKNVKQQIKKKNRRIK